MQLYYNNPWLSESSSLVKISLIALSIIFLQKLVFSPRLQAPFVGFHSRWEPRWFVAVQFSQNALQHIQQGCRQYKDGMSRIARVNTDILVIPSRFVDELHSKPDEQLSAIKAHMKVSLILSSIERG
jgi:hypothetical protein